MIVQPLSPLSPYMLSSRAAPEIVLSILSVVVGAGACSFGGSRPLHKIQPLILCSPTIHLAIRLTIYSPKVFLSSSSDALSILGRSCRLIPELFISSLSAKCCLRPRSLMLLLHSGPLQRLTSDVRPFVALGATLPWSNFL
jgi:hypothetical protein